VTLRVVPADPRCVKMSKMDFNRRSAVEERMDDTLLSLLRWIDGMDLDLGRKDFSRESKS